MKNAECGSRIVIALLAALLLCAPAALRAADDDEQINDVQEQKNYVKGEYREGAEGDTLNVKKGEGFDFKIPEIIITGQIDTKVLLKRETTSLEDLQNVKNVLYEKERISMPYAYLREEELAPQNEDRARSRDFVGKIKLLGGTYSDFLADGTLGKAFDEQNSAVLRVSHNSFDNDIINDRLTYRNMTSAGCFYATDYGRFEAIYDLKGAFNQYGNPYPFNAFGGFYNQQDYEAGCSLSGDINSYGVDAMVNYKYFDEKNSGGGYLYKENRLELSGNAEKDFTLGDQKKIKTILSVSGWDSEVIIGPLQYKNTFNLDLFFKGIFYFEPVVFQGGFRIQDFDFAGNYYRMSPFLKVNYDILPQFSIYADFKPEMKVIDNTELLVEPFTAASSSANMPSENINFRAGAQFDIFETFFDVFYGYKSINNNVYLDATEGGGQGDYIFSYKNDDLDYSCAGFSVETLKLKNIKITLDYEYINIIDQTAETTYLPANSLDAKIIYMPAEWEFTLTPVVKSGQLGATGKKMGAYVSADFSVSRKINDNFTATFFVNNVLNNNYYLLYYYKEKGLNLGAAVTLKF
jgi:hypothetical protein